MKPTEKIVIVGAGPAGLSCAAVLAQAGLDVTVIEKKSRIGGKICAGGITWNGQLQNIPDRLLQRKFYSLQIITPRQRVRLCSKEPMLATVNRRELGQFMLDKAESAGASIISGCRVKDIEDDRVKCLHNGREISLPYSILVGADGAGSIVRRHLGLPMKRYGLGVNFQLPVSCPEMQWHFVPNYFKNGYAWIFPHRQMVSVGAYVHHLPPKLVIKNLVNWAAAQSLAAGKVKPEIERISYDYWGWNFGRIFLAGEAAGIASGLTGEGINAAVQSGEFIANNIIGQAPAGMDHLIKKHRKHKAMVKITRKNIALQKFLPELFTAMLRLHLVSFSKLELTS